MTAFKLLLARLFGSRKAQLDGAVLFADEYRAAQQFTMLSKLYDNPVVRIPVQSNNLTQFVTAANRAAAANITVLALLDAYESHSAMMSRLLTILSKTNVKYIQLFNELPHMTNLYPGERIRSMKELLDKTNEYADWIHQHIGDGKVVTMAPYNSLDSETYPTWDDKTNRDVLKELILYTVADIAGVHLYNESYTDQFNLVRLAKDIKEWNDEAAYEKQIWITECGTEPRDQHVDYYRQMVKLMRNTINPQKIIWYRQCSIKAGDHAKFSLEYTDGSEKSPLYDLLLVE